jgi:hypothetical protein
MNLHKIFLLFQKIIVINKYLIFLNIYKLFIFTHLTTDSSVLNTTNLTESPTDCKSILLDNVVFVVEIVNT